MFDFFIAIFGIIYFAIRCAVEEGSKKADKEMSKRSLEKHQSIEMNAGEQTILSKELEDPVRRNELMHSISSELCEIYGQNWEELFSKYAYNQTFFIRDIPWGIPLHILISKKAKVGALGCEKYELWGPKELRERLIKACEIIERNVKKEHPEMNLVFVPRTIIEPGEKCAKFDAPKTEGINIKKINEIYNIDFENKYKNVLEKYSPEYIEKTQNGYKLTLEGTLLSNNILAEFI